MYLIAYILIFLSTPLVGGYAALGLKKCPSKWKKYFLFYVVTIFIISYSCTPLNECDLTRYFDMVEIVSKLKSIKAIIFFQNDGLFIKNFIFWFIGKTGDYHLLPAFSNSIVYGVAGYITCSIASERKAEKYIPIIFVVQISMLPFFSITSNVRNICTISLVTLAVYLDLVKKKKSILICMLYILPCFIHSCGVII